MTIARINEFHAAVGNGDELFALLTSFTGAIKDLDGCLSVSALRAHEDPDLTVIYEVWESVAAHEAAAQEIPPDAVASAVALLAQPPAGQYFDVA